MKEHRLIFLGTLAMTAMLAVAGCGGGGGGGSDPVVTPPPVTPPPDGGIDRGGVAVGPIDGFGSVIVNGVRFDTSDAVFTINGGAGGQDDLAVGQVVVVKGSIDDDRLTGTATTVSYDDVVKGPVEVGSVDLAGQTFRVLGQTIQVTTSTAFDDSIQPPGLEGLAEGDVVEVSGLPGSDGIIRATRIQRSAAVVYELTGFVSNLDTGAFTFDIGAQTIDYSGAQLDDFPTGGPSNGDYVEAKGSAFTAGGALVATRVELENALGGDDLGENGDDAEIEGYVTGFRSSSDFDLLGIRIRTTASTVFERGTAADVRLDVRLEAEGLVQSDGSVLADKIQFQPEGRLEAFAPVEAVNPVAGTLTLLGILVLTDAGTSFEDKFLGQQSFGLDDLRIGDWVEVRGFEDDEGRFLAEQLEREDPADLDEIELRGTAEDVTAPGFSILGVAVITNGSTEFRDISDAPISAQQFFDAAEGRLVDVDGTWDGTVLTADQASLED